MFCKMEIKMDDLRERGGSRSITPLVTGCSRWILHKVKKKGAKKVVLKPLMTGHLALLCLKLQSVYPVVCFLRFVVIDALPSPSHFLKSPGLQGKSHAAVASGEIV